MSLVQRDLGPRSPWGRFRLAVERFDSLLLDVLARRRADPARTRCSPCCSSSATRTATRPPTGTCATSSWRPARGRPRHLGRVAVLGVRAPRPPSARPGAAARGRPRLPRRGREGGPARAPRAHDRAAPAARAGRDRRPDAPRRRPRRRLPVARDAPRGPLAAAPPRSGRSAGSTAPAPTRRPGSRSAAGCAAAPARPSPRWRCARCCAPRPTSTSGPVRPEPESARRSALVVDPEPGRRDSFQEPSSSVASASS